MFKKALNFPHFLPLFLGEKRGYNFFEKTSYFFTIA